MGRCDHPNALSIGRGLSGWLLPDAPSEDRRPLDRVRDLFDGAKDTRNALMWLSAGEIATVALIGIAAVLLVFILIKRGIS